MKLKFLAQQVFGLLVPKFLQPPLRFGFYKLFRKLDAEMFFVNNLLSSKRRFIDIGANIGIYSYYFSNKFKYSELF